MHIIKEVVPVDPATMKSEIDATKNVVIIVSNGQVSKYPMPEFGTMEIGFNNSKPGRPAYKIIAD